MVDTNSSPEGIDFVIPSNDDATKSIDLVVSNLCDSIKEGLGERKQTKEKIAQEKSASEAAKTEENQVKKEEVKS
jgi:small subunit ribosomal protein S2